MASASHTCTLPRTRSAPEGPRNLSVMSAVESGTGVSTERAWHVRARPLPRQHATGPPHAHANTCAVACAGGPRGHVCRVRARGAISRVSTCSQGRTRLPSRQQAGTRQCTRVRYHAHGGAHTEQCTCVPAAPPYAGSVALARARAGPPCHTLAHVHVGPSCVAHAPARARLDTRRGEGQELRSHGAPFPAADHVTLRPGRSKGTLAL